MRATYPAQYYDRNGSETTVIHNDGALITMVVRGVRFEGNDFDSLEPKDCPDPTQLSSFTFCTAAFVPASSRPTSPYQSDILALLIDPLQPLLNRLGLGLTPPPPPLRGGAIPSHRENAGCPTRSPLFGIRSQTRY